MTSPLGDGLFWIVIAFICVVVLVPFYTPWTRTDIAAYILAKRDAKEFEKERRKTWKEHLRGKVDIDE